MSGHLFMILGFNGHVPLKDVKTRYRELAKLYHPDVSKETGAEEKFKLISNAYQQILQLDWKSYEEQKPKPRPKSTKKSAEQTIFRVLNEKQKSNDFTIMYPFNMIVKNTRFYFLFGMVQFEFFCDVERPLPAKIKAVVSNRNITITIREGY